MMGEREPATAAIAFRPLSTADFPLLGRWLAQPYVTRWWHHDPTPAGVERDFGPGVRGEEPGEDLIALLGDRPFGLVQRSRLDDYPDYRAELAAHVEVPPGTVTIDYLIGEPELTGRGLGPKLIKALVERTWTDHPDAPAIIVPVVAGNRPSWRALERAGLARIGSGDLEPDNPADPPLHHLYRIDRPDWPLPPLP